MNRKTWGIFLLGALVGSSSGSVGNGAPKKQTGLMRHMIQVGELKREYFLYIPTSYNSKSKYPIVMMLHGGGGTGKAAMEETGWDKKAEKEGFIAVFPDATRPDPDLPPRFGSNGQIWNDGSGRFHAGASNVSDVLFLDRILQKTQKDFQVDAHRIYVTGFSNGSSMTFRAGVELSKYVAAIAPVAGAFWLEDVELDHAISVLYMTGTADTLNPMDGGVPRMAGGRRGLGGKAKPTVFQNVQKWVALLDCPTNPKHTSDKNGIRRLSYGPCRNNSEVLFITVEKMGHVWAGGNNKLPKIMVGSDPGLLNATDVIWKFFESHPKMPQREASSSVP